MSVPRKMPLELAIVACVLTLLALQVVPESAEAGLPTPTASKPLRLWTGGDSLGLALSTWLVPSATSTGVIRAWTASKGSSGLTKPSFYDWPIKLRTVMNVVHPKATVFMIGTNDYGNMYVDGQLLLFGSEGWRREYRRRVDAACAIMVRGGALRIYWVGAPVLRTKWISERLLVINRVARAVAAERTKVVFVSSWNVLADAEGGYDPQWRASDGVHLNAAGADRLSDAVMRRICRDWSIPVPAGAR